jgi:flagellar biogenesis protein FliO
LNVERVQEILAARVKGLPLWVWGVVLAAIFLAAALVSGYPAPSQPAAANLPGAGALASTRLAMGVFVKLTLVTGLAYLGLFFLRRGRGRFLVKTNRQLSVLETVHLSPRQALHLVRAGERVLLVGATDQSLTLLGPVEFELPPDHPAAAEDSLPLPAAASFASLFSRYFPAADRDL